MIPWKTIKVGGVDVDTLLDQITESGRHISDKAHEMMCDSTFRITPTSIDVRLVTVTPDELGLVGNKWPLSTIIARGNKLRGANCYPDLAPHLFLQMVPDDIGFGDFIIAMKPFQSDQIHGSVFRITRRDRQNKLLLCVTDADAMIQRVSPHRIVFMVPPTQ